jgi:hypothetical protein
MNFEWDDHPFLVMAGVILALALGFGGLVAIINRAAFPAELVQIEQFRKDFPKIEAEKAEDAMGQAIQINQHIRALKQYNQMWWSDWAIPDAWNDVQLIEIEQKEKGTKP